MRCRNELALLSVTDQTSLSDAIKAIDCNASKIALVVDEIGRLVGTITDGDVRRAILKGIGLSEPSARVMNNNPIALHVDTPREDVFSLMKRSGIRSVPLVDENGVLVSLAAIEEYLQQEQQENWVVIMAGGLGTRLKALTANTPKPMLQLGGKPLIETILTNFIAEGFHRFFFAVNYRSEVIEEYFGKGESHGVQIEYLREEERLGTAGALSLLPRATNKPIIVINGDLLTKVSFKSLLAFHQETNSEATMCVRPHELVVPYGVVDLDGHQVTEIREKPVFTHYVNAGIYALDPSCLETIPHRQHFDMTTLLERLIGQGKRVNSFPIREYWLDIGRPEDFERAATEIIELF